MANLAEFYQPKVGTLSAFNAAFAGFTWTGDLNGDGFDDLIVTGASYPPGPNTPQRGQVFFGDGSGNLVSSLV
ncbi:FG-GAP repeat protein [Sphingomonas oligophenolica]